MKIGSIQLRLRTVLMIAGVFVFFSTAYFYVIPTVVAQRYHDQIEARAIHVKVDLQAVATGPNIVVLEDPDIKLSERRSLIEKALASVREAQDSLNDLKQANSLQTLPGSNLAERYHRALVRKERTDTAVRQSQEVLNEYAAALAYIDAYTEPQLYLERQLNYINSIYDFAAVSGQGASMTAIAAHLQTSSQQLAALAPPPAFTPLHTEALATIRAAATNFQPLGLALNQASDVDVYRAVAALETITLKSEIDHKSLLTNTAQSSPTLEQLGELPEKIENSEQY